MKQLLFVVLLCGALPGWAQLAVRPTVPDPVIPQGSLARTYRLHVLEKPADINKHHIRVLVIRDARGTPVGMRIAGHSEENTCRQTTEIVIKLCKALEAAGARFGAPVPLSANGPAAFYASYGVFAGPVDARYKRPYQEALDALTALSAQHPEGVVIHSLTDADYNALVAQTTQAEALARQQGGAALVVHYFPEPFIHFAAQGSPPAQAYRNLVQAVRQAAGPSYAQRLRQDEQNLSAALLSVGQLQFPSAYRAILEPFPSGRTNAEAPDARARRYRAITDDCFRQPDFVRNQRANAELVAKVGRLASQLNDAYMKRLLEAWVAEANRMTHLDSIRASLVAHFPNSELNWGKAIDSVRIQWKALEADPLRELVDRFRVTQRTYLQFADQMAPYHPFMLSDGVARGWPVFSPEEQRPLYTQGTQLRGAARLLTQYHFLAPDNAKDAATGATGFVGLSGVVFQLVRDGKSEYVNLEDFVNDELAVPFVHEVVRDLLRVQAVDSATTLQVHRWPSGPAPATTVGAYLGGAPSLFEMQSTFSSQPTDSQTVWLRQWLPGSTPLPGLGAAAGRYALPTGRLHVVARSPFAVYGGRVGHLAVRRLCLDPEFHKAVGRRVLLAEREPVWLGPHNWLDVQRVELPSTARPFADVLKATPAPNRPALLEAHLKATLEAARRLGKDLPGSSPILEGRNLYESVLTAFRDNVRSRNLAGRDWEDLQGFLRDLAHHLAERADAEPTLYLVDADPDTWAALPDGNTLILTSVEQAERLHNGAGLAILLGHHLRLAHTDAARITPEQIRSGWQRVAAAGAAHRLVTPEVLQTPDFRLALAFGALRQATRLSALRAQCPPGSPALAELERQLKHVWQPLFEHFLQEAEGAALPEQLEFVVRNLRQVIQALGSGTVYLG
jgi:hypothetical protein